MGESPAIRHSPTWSGSRVGPQTSFWQENTVSIRGNHHKGSIMFFEMHLWLIFIHTLKKKKEEVENQWKNMEILRIVQKFCKEKTTLLV